MIIHIDDENDTLLFDQRNDQNHLLENWLGHELRQENKRNDLQNLLFLKEQKINYFDYVFRYKFYLFKPVK